MGATCSNCNCNRDERDNELKIDEKGVLSGGNQVTASHATVQNNNRQQQMGENVLGYVYNNYGKENVRYQKVLYNRLIQDMNADEAQISRQKQSAVGGLDPTATFDDHHYGHREGHSYSNNELD